MEDKQYALVVFTDGPSVWLSSQSADRESVEAAYKDEVVSQYGEDLSFSELEEAANDYNLDCASLSGDSFFTWINDNRGCGIVEVDVSAQTNAMMTLAQHVTGDAEEAEKLCRLLMSGDESIREQGKALMQSFSS